MFTHFQLGGHEPGVVICHHLRHLSGPRNELFYSFRAWWISGIYAYSEHL